MGVQTFSKGTGISNFNPEDFNIANKDANPWTKGANLKFITNGPDVLSRNFNIYIDMGEGYKWLVGDVTVKFKRNGKVEWGSLNHRSTTDDYKLDKARKKSGDHKKVLNLASDN